MSSACELRLAKVRTKMAEQKIEALFVRNLANIAWLTNFKGVFDDEPAHALIITADASVLHSDSRYSAALRACAEGTPIVIDDSRVTHHKILLESASVATLGIETSMTLQEYRSLTKALADASASTELREFDRFIEALREVKDDEEIETMRKAQAITDAGFEYICTFMKPGMTEREVQLELDNFMFAHGAEGLAFPTIVATGAHAASPHAQPGDAIIEQGHAVVMDFGATYLGYTSDMTRTVFMGEPGPELTRAWQVLRQANEECEALVREGVTGEAVHKHAEDVLAQGGFAGKMGHGLGHSLGVEVHEDPVLSPRNKQPLCAGNVLTVEPGIYLEGQFGMRLEDFGVVRRDGYEVITKSTHEMVII